MRKIMKAVGIELSKTESESLKTTEELLKKMQMELSDITFVDTTADRAELASCISQFEKIVKKYTLKKSSGATEIKKEIALDLSKKKRTQSQRITLSKRDAIPLRDTISLD